jgi:DNA polymerase-3 subunit gamma/tau
LKEAALLSLGEDEIVIQLPAGIVADTIERRRPEIEGVFARALGRPTRLVVRTGPATSVEAAPAAAPAAPSIAQTEAAEKQARSARLKDAARTHPNVREAAKILEGGITDVEEL